MTSNLVQTETPKADSELLRTSPPEKQPPNFIWFQDTFRCVGYNHIHMTEALSALDVAQKKSFKKAILAFAVKGDYATRSIITLAYSLNSLLKQFRTNSFDITWIAKILEKQATRNHIGMIKSFFIFWKAQDPSAITGEALQVFFKTKRSKPRNSNVLSDDPEKSWLSPEEYSSLLADIWRNYESGHFSTSQTFMLLLSMQYARRPTQLSYLKIKDFRIAAANDASGLSGPMVSFPSIKDMTSESGFRDSKFEHHPVPSHLWNLFEVLRCENRKLFNYELGINLSDSELEMLPVFITTGRIQTAISELSNHYKLKWRSNLDHILFHLHKNIISNIIAWRPNSRQIIKPPLSHRTGRPIVVNATRLRHTRARQLARKGVPMHVLSHWLGHTDERSIQAYYNDPAEDARKLDEAMSPALIPLAMAFAGNLIDNEEQASRYKDPTSRLELAQRGKLKTVGSCGKHSFCATTSVPIPCYRCRHFEPLVTAPHEEVLEALKIRQEEENQALRIGGARNLLIPIDLSEDILAVQNCIDRCNAHKAEQRIL